MSTGYGLARVLSKRGICSRTEAFELIRAGRVRVLGKIVRDPENRTALDAEITLDGQSATSAQKRYFMLNKPRGWVSTTRDEKGRDTVLKPFSELNLPHLAPVGRLDQASEGLLLLSNDSSWSARITDPLTHLTKTYHVQFSSVPSDLDMEKLRAGILDQDEQLHARSVELIRTGGKTAWLEFVLTEGKNRQIRRMGAALELEVVRLIRVKIGDLELGSLAKGHWRELDISDLTRLGS